MQTDQVTQRMTLLTSPDANTDSPLDFRPPVPQSASASNTIDQVRELLYGEAMRHQDRWVDDMEVTLQTLEQTLHRRLGDVQAAIEVLGRTLRIEQAEATRSIGLAIIEIGRQVASLGEDGSRGADRKYR